MVTDNRLKRIWEKADSLNGCLSHLKTTKGRRHYSDDEDPLKIRNPFVSDEAKILSSKFFRVMSDKTQVFTKPNNSLVRSRQKHVFEVAAVSVIASELLGLNTDLVRAGAYGHDIGHVPFGHQGESWMAREMGKPGFCHEKMGPIIAQKVERKGKGLNLTHETLEAMLRHSGNTAKDGMSQEAWLIRYTDKFAYIFHDVNDIVVRMGYPVSLELSHMINFFGSNQRERTTTVIAGLVIESAELGRVSFEHSELGAKFTHLRNLMYEVYPHVTQQNVAKTMEDVFEFLDMLKLADPFFLLAIMTDTDVLMVAKEKMRDWDLFKKTALYEIVPYLDEIGRINLCDPGLDW